MPWVESRSVPIEIGKLVNKTLTKRLKTWLFIGSLCVMILGPLIANIANRLLDAQFQTEWLPQTSEGIPPIQAACVPSVDQAAYELLEKLEVGQNADPAVSKRMVALFLADQAARQSPVGIDTQKVNQDDTLRRIEVLDYITKGQIRTTRDLVYGAFIFQHGDCPEHYRFANRLAQIAMDAGYSDARWIYAATLDRYLLSLGEPQKYGTQYSWIDGEWVLYPVDPKTTDAERAKYNVPPLSEATNQEPGEMKSSVVRQAWLETWWLTLIGSGFAALSAIIGMVDPKLNPPHGRVVLAIAITVILVSVAGHYLQMNALSQGSVELQGNVWRVINSLMVLIWFGFAVVEIFRVVKPKSS
jgi:hypothetical protein